MMHPFFCFFMWLFSVSLNAKPVRVLGLEDVRESQSLSQDLGQLVELTKPKDPEKWLEKRILSLKKYSSVFCKDHGLELHCVIQNQFHVNRILIEGLPYALLEEELRKRLAIYPGQILDPGTALGVAQIDSLRLTTQSFLERQGFYGALVSVFPRYTKTSQLDIMIQIQNGQFLKVNRVVVGDPGPFKQEDLERAYGNLCFSLQTVVDALVRGSAACYIRFREQAVSDGLEGKLRSLGYLYGNVSVRKKNLDPKSPETPLSCQSNGSEPKCVELFVEVEKGPVVKAEVVFSKPTLQDLNWFQKILRVLTFQETLSRLLGVSLVGLPQTDDKTVLLFQIREAIEFSKMQKVDAEQTELMAQKIKNYLEKRGYYFSKVFPKKVFSSKEEIRLRFEVDLGESYALKKIAIQLKEPLPLSLDELYAQIQSRVRFFTHSGHVQRLALEQDRLRLYNHLIALGYEQVGVRYLLRLIGKQELELIFDISAIAPKKVYHIEIKNGDEKLDKKLLPLLSLCKQYKANHSSPCQGNVFTEYALLQDEEKIRSFYEAEGYWHNSLVYETKETPEGVYIRYQFANPLKEKIQGLWMVDGARQTNLNAIRYQMGYENLGVGQKLVPNQLDEGLARLKKTNVLNKTKLDYIENEDGLTDMVLSLSEKESQHLDVSFNFSTDHRFSLGAEYVNDNWLGYLLKLNSRLDFGLFIGRRSILANQFKWGSLLGSPLDLELTLPFLLYEDKPYLEIPERHFQTLVASSLALAFTETLSWYMKTSLRLDQWSDHYLTYSVLEDAGESFAHLDGLVDVFQESPSARMVLEPGLYFVDVDDLFNPHQGFRLRLFSQISNDLSGQNPPFFILGGQVGAYVPLKSSTWVFSLGFQRALIENPSQNWWVLKYQSDLETLGGDKGPRGFEEGSIGLYGMALDDQGNPDALGRKVFYPGNWSLRASSELRFPLFPKLGWGDLYGAFFVDAGATGICEGFFDCSALGEQQYGVGTGFGFRYMLPIGPLALDLAIAPYRQGSGWFNRQGRIHLFFGYPF